MLLTGSFGYVSRLYIDSHRVKTLLLYSLSRLVERVQYTLRGSADDIGWLQRVCDFPAVDDRTDRFVQLLGLVG